MTVDFDRLIKRRGSGSIKWQRFEEDVIPMWIADMDFECPESVLTALRQRISHGIFGYSKEPAEIREVIIDRLYRRYNWKIDAGSILFFPGVVNALNLIYRAIIPPKSGVLVHTPAYPKFLETVPKAGLIIQGTELSVRSDGAYEIDFEEFEAAIEENSQLYILCNPHNPVGKVFNKEELEKTAQICLEKDLLICSDDIHCDLVFSGKQYLPIASLDKEIADRTITLISPGKTFNLAGVMASVAIVSNDELREKLKTLKENLDICVNVLGYTATLSAYRDGDSWLSELLNYLESNRDILERFVNEKLPGIRMTKPDGTFLAWLDCRQTGIGDSPYDFFLKNARVAFNDGTNFGKGGNGFIRLNFGCPKSVLKEALKRLEVAIGPPNERFRPI